MWLCKNCYKTQRGSNSSTCGVIKLNQQSLMPRIYVYYVRRRVLNREIEFWKNWFYVLHGTCIRSYDLEKYCNYSSEARLKNLYFTKKLPFINSWLIMLLILTNKLGMFIKCFFLRLYVKFINLNIKTLITNKKSFFWKLTFFTKIVAFLRHGAIIYFKITLLLYFL